jgi:hypothetical protein
MIGFRSFCSATQIHQRTRGRRDDEKHQAHSLHIRRREDDDIMALTKPKWGVLVEFQPMSPEEIERTVQFLLQQQAQFAADSAKTDARISAMADGIIGLTGIVGHLAAAQQRTDERLDERFTELGGYIKTVESHLNAVINTFERHLREDHGHQPS